MCSDKACSSSGVNSTLIRDMAVLLLFLLPGTSIQMGREEPSPHPSLASQVRVRIRRGFAAAAGTSGASLLAGGGSRSAALPRLVEAGGFSIVPLEPASLDDRIHPPPGVMDDPGGRPGQERAGQILRQ